MRKKVVLGFVAAFGTPALLALFGGNYLIQNNQAHLLEWAARSLGRKVSAEHIEVAFWPLSARLSSVVIGADLSPAAGEFLRAKTVKVEVKIWPLFLGRFVPSNVVLESPVLTIARDNGKSAGDTMPRRSRKRQRQTATLDNTVPAAAPQTPPILLPFALQVTDGTVRYQNELSENEVLASQIQLRMKGVDSSGPTEVDFAAAVTARAPNTKFKGRIGPGIGAGSYRDIPIDVALQVEALDMGKINRALPALKQSLPRVLQFDGVYNTRDLTIKGSLNSPTIKGTIKGSDASVRFD